MALECYLPENVFTEKMISRGTRVLRGSHDIIPIDPVQVGHERQLLMDFHVVEDLLNCRRHYGCPGGGARSVW